MIGQIVKSAFQSFKKLLLIDYLHYYKSNFSKYVVYDKYVNIKAQLKIVSSRNILKDNYLAITIFFPSKFRGANLGRTYRYHKQNDGP